MKRLPAPTSSRALRMAIGLFLIEIIGPDATLAPAAEKWRGGLNFFVGQKATGKDWEPVDFQDSTALEVTAGPARWPVALAFDYRQSNEESSDGGVRVKGKTAESSAGVRKVWESGIRRTYVGGGAAFLQGRMTLPETGRTDSDSTFGPWIDGGAFWRLGKYFGLGFAGRYSRGNVHLLDEERPAGGPQAGFLLSWGWPD